MGFNPTKFWVFVGILFALSCTRFEVYAQVVETPSQQQQQQQLQQQQPSATTQAIPSSPVPAVTTATPKVPETAPVQAAVVAQPPVAAPSPPQTAIPTTKNETKLDEKDKAIRQKLAAAQLEIVKLRIEMEEFQERQRQKKRGRKRGPSEDAGDISAGPAGGPLMRGPFPIPPRKAGDAGPSLPFQPFKGKDLGFQQWSTIMNSILHQPGRRKNDSLTIVDWGSHNGFFSLSFAFALPKATVISVDIMADVGKKLVGPNVYRVYGPARHASMRQKMNIKNNVMCNLVITPEVFTKFSRKGGVLVDYQWIRYPFHIMNFEDTPSFQSWLCSAIHLAKTTFISFPPVDVFVDRDRVARNILGAAPLRSFIEESVASCSNDKVDIEMFQTPPKQRRLARIDLVNTNLLSSHSCSDIYDSLECEPSPFDKADCSAVEENSST